MDVGVTFLIKYGDRGCAKQCSFGTTREELIAFVTSKWSGISKEEVYLSYDFMGAGELDITDENDMITMFRLLEESNLHRVNIMVRKIGGGVVGNVESVGVIHSTTEVGECSQVSNVSVPHVGVDGGVVGRRLLSEEWRLLIVGPGQRFVGGAVQFRKSLIMYSIQVGFEFQYLRNGPKRVSAACRFRLSRHCQWRINAVQDPADSAMVITMYDRNHSCGTVFGSVSTRRLNHHIVSDLIVDEVRSMPGLNAVQVQRMMKRNYGVDISYSISWKALDRAKRFVFGDHTSSFGLLPVYFDELLRVNPGSYVHLDVGDDHKFRRCFLAFKASLLGFSHCRPLIMVDGTFLKGRHKGCLLSAVAKDGEEGLYPIGFAVVSEESDDNWEYFFYHLRAALCDTRTIVFVSDRNHGILKAVASVFPNSPHAYCYNHLKANLEYRCRSLGKRGRAMMLSFFQKCAYATTEQQFVENAQKMINLGGPMAESFFNDTPKHMWAVAYFDGCRYGHMTSNACESWNSQIREERQLPIVSMLDGIRVKLMQQMTNRRQAAAAWPMKLCKSIEVEINLKVGQARGWDVRKASDTIWEVFSVPSAVVDLERRACSCMMWQISGLPCSHAVAVVFLKLNGNYQYIDRYYHAEMYRAMYSNVIFPICMPVDAVALVLVTAPDYHQTRGRPKKRRMPSQGEHIRRRIRCGLCGVIGHHNRKTCRMAGNRG